jgi:TATA-box binding protein (TBP) (component of TFIID and TFIIIB)
MIDEAKNIFQMDKYRGETLKPVEVEKRLNTPSNIVYSCTLNKPGVPLKIISSFTSDLLAYNTNDFPACQFSFRYGKNRINVMIFSSSSVSVVGATSKYIAIFAIKEVFKKFSINKLSKFNNCEISNFTVNNIVIPYFIGYKIDLKKFTRENINQVQAKDKFPGVYYKPTDSSVINIAGTAAVFKSGNINFVGIKNKRSFRAFKNYVLKVVSKYKKI